MKKVIISLACLALVAVLPGCKFTCDRNKPAAVECGKAHIPSESCPMAWNSLAVGDIVPEQLAHHIERLDVSPALRISMDQKLFLELNQNGQKQFQVVEVRGFQETRDGSCPLLLDIFDGVTTHRNVPASHLYDCAGH